MFAKLLPRSAPYFEYFKQQSGIMLEMARLLVHISSAESDAEESLKLMSHLEEKADKLRLIIIQDLSQTFITPIDREDIYAICTAQERVIDSLHGLGTRFFLYSFVHLRFPAKKMVLNLVDMCEGVGEMLGCLSGECKLSDAVKEVQSRKENSEMLLVVGMGELLDQDLGSFDQSKHLLAWTQLYDRIEQTVTLLGDLSDTLEQAVLKYA